jgi:hypothetical protein
MTEHRHRRQLPRWSVLVIVAGFLAIFRAGLMLGGWGPAVGLAAGLAFLGALGAGWGYDSTDGRNWRGPPR